MAKRVFEPACVRNFALVGHRSSGKTSLGEMLLHTAGVTRKMGQVEQGTSLLDHEAAERRRRMTLGPSVAWMEWREHLLQLVDTPGNESLAHERRLAISLLDATVVVLSARDGVEFGSNRAFREALALKKPVVVAINKMDRPSDIKRILSDIERVTDKIVVPMQLPFFNDSGEFVGVVSLLDKKLLLYDQAGGVTARVQDIPDECSDDVASGLEALAEAAALSNDGLLEQYLEYFELPADVIRKGLADAIASCHVLPVVYTSALGGIGAQSLLDLLTWALPASSSAEAGTEQAEGTDFMGQVLARRLDADGNTYSIVRVRQGNAPTKGRWFQSDSGEEAVVRKLYQLRGSRRTSAFYTGPGALVATWDRVPGRPGDGWSSVKGAQLNRPSIAAPMMSYLLRPATQSDQDRLVGALQTLLAMDCGLRVERDGLTGGVVLSGMNKAHIDEALALVRDRFHINVSATLPPVGYREMPARVVRGIAGRHRIVCRGELIDVGECELDVAPQSPDQGNTISNELSEEKMPSKFIPAVQAGVETSLTRGPTAGYPVLGAHVRCIAGEYDVLESTEEHLKLAGAQALRNALTASGTHLLEPWYTIEVMVPSGEVGVIFADVCANRGRVLGMEIQGQEAVIQASYPHKELRSLATRLERLTAGRAVYTATLSHYAPLAEHDIASAVASSPFDGSSAAALAGEVKS